MLWRILPILASFAIAIPAHAATYYVRPDGNDGASGRSHAEAWRTISKVNSFSFATGDDVLFVSGGVWHDSQLRVDWPGTAADNVVIGSYFLRNSVETVGVGTSGKPQINGTYESSCRASNPSTCDIDTSAAVPASHYSGLVNVSTSHVTVQDLRIVDSAGAGVRHEGNNTQSNLTVQNVDFNQIFGAAIWFDYAKYGTARNNTINLSALERVDGRFTSWGGAIVLNDARPSYGLVEGNTLANTGGEGIITIRSTHIVIRGNTISNTRRPAVDLDNTSDSIVEHNMMLGNGYMDGRDESFGAGITISVEPFGEGRTFDSVRNIVRNNLMANTRACFDMSMFRGSVFNCGSNCNDPASDGRKIGARIIGNTCLQDKSNYFQSDEGILVNNNIESIEIRNNVFAGKTGANCTFPTAPDTLVRISNNVYWPTGPSDPDCSGTSDVIGDPRIPLDFRGAKTGNIPSVASFKPGAGSVAAGAGVALTRTVVDLSRFSPGYGRSSVPCSAVDTRELSYDFMCAARSSRPDVGALSISGSTSGGYTLTVD